MLMTKGNDECTELFVQTDRKWTSLKVTNIFDRICRGKRLKKANHIPGQVPYVSSTANNNGVDDYIEAVTGTRVFSNCISLANSGSVGTAFYEPFSFVASDHVTALKTTQASKFAYLFMATSIEKQKSNFNFNREINDIRVRNMRIMLPITDTGEPNYKDISDYAEQKQRTMLAKYLDYAEKRIAELGTCVKIPNLGEKEWDEFHIDDLFEVSRPTARNTTSYLIGNVPLIASGSVNNGVMKFCAPFNNETLDKGNCITVSPVDGSTFYHPMSFLGRGGAGSSILILRCSDLNLYRGEFMARAIKQTCSKYTYGHMGNMDSIKQERIMLPVTSSSHKLDYNYMELYVKNWMLRKYQQYINFIGSQE